MLNLDNIRLMYGCPVTDFRTKPKVEVESEPDNMDNLNSFNKLLSDIVTDDGISKLIEETDFSNIEFDYNKEIDYFLKKLEEALKNDSVQSTQRCLRLWKMIYMLKLGNTIINHQDEFGFLNE